ncbi:MAG: 30S ribosomal protein S6--L-glutamate ligase [Chitinophagales bacterium]|nr:30S ribosomal protein S6--L-glutamate ligase [Chitinophagales bacterium]
MKIAILSRGPFLYSTQSLVKAGQRRGHEMHIIDHTRCLLSIGRGRPQVYYDGYQLPLFDAIIPRIGASVTQQGAAVINQFELMRTFSVANADALLQCRDKLRCLQKLAQKGIAIPQTVSVVSGEDLFPVISSVGGLPVVIKLLESTHGVGVILAETFRNAEATIEAFHRLKERVIVQEFIKEVKGTDIRAIVVGGKVVAAMKRQAKAGEFRSNLHRGATAEKVVLTEAENQLVSQVAKLMKLNFAGVDFLRSNRGGLIMEVNASPGLEGIEGVTEIDVAGKVIELIEKECKEVAI